MQLSSKTIVLFMLSCALAAGNVYPQNMPPLDVEIRSACVVVVGTVAETLVSEGDNGMVTSAIKLSECEILGSRVSEHIEKDPDQPWQGIIDEINGPRWSVNTTSLGFEVDASFPVELGKTYLFFLKAGSSGGLTNHNILIPALKWSPALRKAVLASKALKTAELKNGKVTVRVPEIDPFDGTLLDEVKNPKSNKKDP